MPWSWLLSLLSLGLLLVPRLAHASRWLAEVNGENLREVPSSEEGAEPSGSESQKEGPEMLTFVPFPTVVVNFGSAWRVHPRAAVSFNFDVEAGVMAMADIVPAQLILRPTVGYGYDTHPGRGGHRFTVGLGVGVGNEYVSAIANPRFVYGSGGRVGVRSGLRLEAWMHVAFVEVSHQRLWSRRGDIRDELLLVAGVDLVMVVLVPVFLKHFSPGW